MKRTRLRLRATNYEEQGALRIVRTARAMGYEVLLDDAHRAWTAYSESMAAGWMHMPDDALELWALVEPYFEPDDD